MLVLHSEQMRCRHKNLYDMRAALRWACQIASALAALHDHQPAYVHNDVKADNVFLTDVSQNMFLSDVARVGASDAKLGDLKPHRWVYAGCGVAATVSRGLGKGRGLCQRWKLCTISSQHT